MKKKKIELSEKQVLYALIFILIASTVIDIYTALSSPVFLIAETNPIYLLTNSVIPLLVTAVLVTAWIIVNLNNRISLIKIFVFSMISLYLSVGHGFGAWSNIYATDQYEQDKEGFIESVKDIDVRTKITSYSMFVGVVMFMPILISIAAFYITMFFYNKRKSKREKVIDDILKSAWKLVRG